MRNRHQLRELTTQPTEIRNPSTLATPPPVDKHNTSVNNIPAATNDIPTAAVQQPTTTAETPPRPTTEGRNELSPYKTRYGRNVRKPPRYQND